MSTRTGVPRIRGWFADPVVTRRLMQGVVIVGVLGLSAAIALVTTNIRIDFRLVIAAVLAAIGVVLIVRQPRAGAVGVLLILATAGLANVVSVPTPSSSQLVFSLLLAIGFTGLWLIRMVADKDVRLLPSPINAPVLVWCIVSVIAFGWSRLFIDPLVYVPRSFLIVQIAALLVNMLLPIQSLYVINVIGGLNYEDGICWLRRIVWLILGIGAFSGVSELLHLPISAFYSNGIRGLFSMWVFVLALALFLYDASLSKVVKAGLLALMGLWFYRNFVESAFWLSGWLPMFVAAAVVIYMRSRRLFLVVLAGALILGSMHAHELYMSVVETNVEEGSTSRLELWSVALGYLERHPLFGMGPAGYAAYYMTYNPFDARSTHNNLFDVAGQTGLIGLGVFFWLGITAFRMNFRLAREIGAERNFEAALAAAVTGGVVGALAGTLLGDWVLPFAYNQTISGFDNAVFTWIMIGAGGALLALRRAREGASQ